METIRKEYRLRNQRDRVFVIEATAEGSGSSGSVVRSTITGPDGKNFRCEVVFEGEFTATKPDFDEKMYLETALSVLAGKIESHDHRDTRIQIHRSSGLMNSDTEAKLEF